MNRKYLGATVFALALAVVPTGCASPNRPLHQDSSFAGEVTEPRTSSTPIPDEPLKLSLAPSPEKPAPNSSPSDCSAIQNWNLDQDGTGSAMIDAEVVSVRVGQHTCFDRVIIDIDTSAEVGSTVRYVDVVHQDGSGFEVPVAGNAVLEVILRAPAYNLVASGAPYKYSAPQFSNWGALREVGYAGSLEGQTTFAIGVIDMNAFAVTTWEDHGIRKVIIDIAH